MYADDPKLYFKVENINDCSLLQHDLNIVHDQSEKWGMKFNAKKSKVMSVIGKINPILFAYIIDRQPLERVGSFCDFGLEVNNTLTWNNHVNKCCKKANQHLGFIKRKIGFNCNMEVKLLCYTSLIRPLLEYNTVIWNNFSQV